jgi:hypothetical protein
VLDGRAETLPFRKQTNFVRWSFAGFVCEPSKRGALFGGGKRDALVNVECVGFFPFDELRVRMTRDMPHVRLDIREALFVRALRECPG